MFVSFEGSEGVGKSTLVASLTHWLREQGNEVVNTREPGGTELAEKIREMVLKEDMCADTELLLMFAARAQHVHEVIQPALAEGKWVLCDRFVDASFAYQGAGRGLAVDNIQLLQDRFVHTMPQVTFWLDAPVEVGLQRALARKETDRFEQQKVDFFKKIQQGYAQRVQQEPQRFLRIDAMQNAQQVFEQCKEILTEQVKVER